MTDRELLELAAKAAGIEVTAIVADGVPYRFGGGYWNPLTDDGDAFRLAVKLNILRGFIYGDEVSWSPSDGPFIEPIVGGDPYAATRRAIVRAAAAIGKEAK